MIIGIVHICGVVLITLSYFSRHLNTMGELCLPLTDFIEWGGFFSGKGEKRGMGEMEAKTGRQGTCNVFPLG